MQLFASTVGGSVFESLIGFRQQCGRNLHGKLRSVCIVTKSGVLLSPCNPYRRGSSVKLNVTLRRPIIFFVTFYFVCFFCCFFVNSYFVILQSLSVFLSLFFIVFCHLVNFFFLFLSPCTPYLLFFVTLQSLSAW